MFSKSVFAFLLFTLVSIQSRADLWDDFVRQYPALQSVLGTPECPSTPAELPDQTAQDLWNRGKTFQSRGKGCDAAQAFFELIRQYPIAPWWTKGWAELINSYMLAKDYVLVMNEGNQFLDQHIGTAAADEVHYLVLKAVHLQSLKFGPDVNQQWNEFALGINGKQHQINPYFVRLSYSSYLSTYPEGRHAAEIRQWQQDARNALCDHYMTVGRYYYEKRQYLAAVLRYAVILEWGAGIRAFPEALYETIRTQWDFAKALRDPKQIDDKRLLELLRTDDKAALSTRDQVADDTKKEALQILAKMKQKLPASEWTTKAQAWIDRN